MIRAAMGRVWEVEEHEKMMDDLTRDSQISLRGLVGDARIFAQELKRQAEMLLQELRQW